MLRPDEVVVSVHIPSPAPDTVSCYVKAMNRKVWSFALVGVAAVVRFKPQSRHVAEARLVLNGVAPIPWRSPDAERELVGRTLTEQTIDRAAEAALSNARPLAHNAYKLPLAAGLIRQALAAL